jgi:hypothetical protein
MEAGRKRQIYLGPETRPLLEWMAAAKKARAAARIEADQRAKLCDMLAAGGAFVENPAVVKVLQFLSERGLLRLGAVLVGAHAFGAYGNMLGVRLEQGALRTRRQPAQLVRHALAFLAPGLKKRLTGIGIKGSGAR